ncbi:MAG TPA: lamin tail domain-containing protein, partial [Balneolaceae bacterium]|nr:lamin tail domain-containing protein [Balneolaceae bacterium]
MRGYIICIVLLLLCLAVTGNGQAQSVNFQDGFEDGDFSNNPAWNGDTNQFTVVDENPNYLLQLNASVSPAYLSTASSQIIGSWEFYIEFRGFEPSGSNQANIFLMSDIANLTGNVNGYSVQVGQSGDDFFKIVRYDNGSEATTILTDTTVVQGGMGYTIKATRSQTGTWQLEVGKGYGGPLHNSGNTGTDSTYTSASFFGPKVNFTSTRADKFFFDFKIDLPPFVTTKANLSGGQSVDIAFNRSVDQTTVSNGDFSLNNGLGTPASISFPAPDTARITYNQPLPSNRYVLSVGGISDQSGNQILTNDQETFTVFGKYSDGDVKINEFMYDPPGNQSEYIEIKNTSSKYLNLSNWKIGDDSGNDILYSASIPLNPHSLLVISADTAALFNSYGPRSYWQPYNLPSLNNGGDAVRILTATGVLVDSLAYRPEWGGQSVALERRSVTTASTYRENWGDSPNINGGTPGFPNEIAPDTASPKLTYFNIRTDNMIALGFDERLNPDSAANILNYGISNSNISSVQVSAPDTVNLS